MAEIPANVLQINAVIVDSPPIPAPAAIVLRPESGSTPQSYAFASFST